MKKSVLFAVAVVMVFVVVEVFKHNREMEIREWAINGHAIMECPVSIDIKNVDGDVLKWFFENQYYLVEPSDSTSSLPILSGENQMKIFERSDAAEILLAYINFGGNLSRAAKLYLLDLPYTEDDMDIAGNGEFDDISLDREFKLPYAKKVIEAYQNFDVNKLRKKWCCVVTRNPSTGDIVTFSFFH